MRLLRVLGIDGWLTWTRVSATAHVTTWELVGVELEDFDEC